jgi:hypothetical protein
MLRRSATCKQDPPARLLHISARRLFLYETGWKHGF